VLRIVGGQVADARQPSRFFGRFDVH
jgi:hypothetical protein